MSAYIMLGPVQEIEWLGCSMSAYLWLRFVWEVGWLGRWGVLTVGPIVQVNLCHVSKSGKHTPHIGLKKNPHKTMYNTWILIDPIYRIYNPLVVKMLRIFHRSTNCNLLYYGNFYTDSTIFIWYLNSYFKPP